MTTAQPPSLEEVNKSLPVHRVPDAVHHIATANAEASAWTVVLDDDPTGAQTVRGVPVVMEPWSEQDLRWAADSPATTTVALTNSRSLEADDAAATVRRIVRQATGIATDLGLRLRILTRSDSTLRGHLAAELTAAREALTEAGEPVDGVVFVPCFLEAGRFTIDDVQWVRRGADMVPAAHTEFARDATFGYSEVDLPSFVSRRLELPDAAVESVSLSDLRTGPERLANRLCSVSGGKVVVVNAADPADLEVLMLAIQSAERRGTRLLLRTGPSFVRLCAGQPEHPALSPAETAGDSERPPHGLIVVGSHTELTNAQLAAAQAAQRLVTVEMAVPAVLDPATRDAEIERCARELRHAIGHCDAVLRTSREVIHRAPAAQLEVSRTISASLGRVTTHLARENRLRFLVAKGGITSSDVVTQALGASKAIVIGQMFPGQISVWELIDGVTPGLPYVVFPGNVGTDDALASIIGRLGQ